MEKFHLKDKSLLTLITTMIVAVIASAGLAFFSLYETAYQQESSLLSQFVRAEKELIAAVGRFDARNSRQDHPGGALGGTLSQVIEAHNNYWPIHKTGKVSLIETSTDQITPIFTSSNTETWVTDRYSLNGSGVTLPYWLEQALEHITKQTDLGGIYEHKGKLIAYEKFEISTHQFIYLAKVDIDEIRQPFIQAGVTALILVAILLLIGSYRFVRTINPLLTDLNTQASLNKTILDTAKNPIVTIDSSGNVNSLNHAAVKLFGYPSNNIVGKSFKTLFPNISDSFPLQPNTENIYYLTSTDGEFTGQKANGDIFPIQTSFGEVQFLGDVIFVGVFSDLTEKKNAELNLRDNLARTHAIVDTVKDCIITIDEEGIIQSMNPAGEKIFGYYIGELEGNSLDLLLPDDFIKSHHHGVSTYLKSGNPNVIGKITELTAKRKDGNIIPIELSVSDIYVGGKRMFVGVIRDISDRKEAEREIMQHRDHLEELVSKATTEIKAIVQTAVNGVVSIDETGSITLFNPAAEKLFGWKADEVIGKNVNILVPQPLGAEHDHYIQRYLDTNEKHIIDTGREVTALRKDGSTFPAHLSVGHSKLKEDHHLFVAFIADISKQKQAEIQLRTAKEKAETAANAKSNFLANMSHEIRTPMNAIIGFAEIALQDQSLQRNTKQYIETILNSGRNLLSIINDILDFSKIEAGKIDIENVTFHLGNAIKDTLRTLQHKASEKNIELIVNYTDDISIIRCGDPTRLRQILINLIGNAIKFTEKGSVTIQISQTNDHDIIGFEIIDTGIGMHPEQLERIFESFSQADSSTTRRFGGTGLGTTISKQIVELMGGRISVKSEYGKGTSFHFTVNLPESTNLEECLFFSSHTDEDYLSPRCFNILLAEDITANATLAQLRLEQMGHKVTWANDGKKALSYFSKNNYDIVLMDIQMPELDGISTTKEIRKLEGNKGHTPIIALTASVMKEDQHKCFEAGMDNIVGKPIDFDLLFKTMEELAPAGVGLTNLTTADTLNIDDKKVNFDAIKPLVDLEKALATWRDNRVYVTALNDFAKTHRNDSEQLTIIAASNQPDLDQAKQLTHALKGVSSNLSITKLSQLATSLDNLLNTTGINQESKTLINQLALELQLTCDMIEKIELPEKTEQTVLTYDAITVHRLIKELIEKINELNPESTEPVLEELHKYINTDELTPIEKHINNFDFELALKEASVLSQNHANKS